jgi:hypothetical protein
MNSKVVVVKDVDGVARLRCVCYATENLVFVTSKEAFWGVKSGASGLFPIGFPSEDVFIYEGQDLVEPVDWDKMKRWTMAERG